jgi:hypothetical protein
MFIVGSLGALACPAWPSPYLSRTVRWRTDAQPLAVDNTLAVPAGAFHWFVRILLLRGVMSSNPSDTTDSTDETDVGEGRLLMSDLSITHHGRYYHFAGYRYERLVDAIAFAQLDRERPSLQRTDPPAFVQVDAVEVPTADDRQLMLDLSIAFENGSFVFEGFHYDRLIDAANYARHRRQLGSKAL